MGIHRKKSSAKKTKTPAEFGAALAQARQEADHIFKQASKDETSKSTTAALITSPARRSTSNDDLKVSPRSKAAAWAWYQRGGGNNSSGTNPEEVRNRAMVVMKRTSRFKAEALRVNGSYTADDTIIKAEQKWDPNQSLFDSFELLCVARELDKALMDQHMHQLKQGHQPPPLSPSARKRSEPKHLVSLSCSSPSFLRRAAGGNVNGGKESFTGLLSRLIPAPILCITQDDIATTTTTKTLKTSSNKMRRGTSLGSGAFGRISRMLTNSPSSKSQGGEVIDVGDDDGALHHHRHEHFHHHHHHHHHHESF